MPADLLLIDISMPAPNGWAVARQLRESGFDQLVIMVISANPQRVAQTAATGTIS